MPATRSRDQPRNGHSAGEGVAGDVAVGDAVGPALRVGGERDRHLQQRVALVEVHLELEVQRRLAAAEADRQADARVAEAAVEPGADPQRAGLLDPPVVAGERRRHRLLPAVGVEGPGVGGVAAQVQAQAVDHLGAAELDRAEAAAAQRHGDEAVRERVARGREGRGFLGRGGPRPGVDLELPAAGGGDLGLEEDARDQLVRVGLHLLERHRRAGLVADPALAPVVEVEIGLGLDEGAPRLGCRC